MPRFYPIAGVTKVCLDFINVTADILKSLFSQKLFNPKDDFDSLKYTWFIENNFVNAIFF